MTELKHTWAAGAFDAVSLMVHHGQCTLEGIDGDQVELEGELGASLTPEVSPEPVGRWLRLYQGMHSGPAYFRLCLPKTKAWVVELSAGRGRVEVTGLQARLSVMVGKGDIRVRGCQGVFNLASGDGWVELERVGETEMPERRPLDRAEPEPQFPPWCAPNVRHPAAPWDWLGWAMQDWDDWGAQMGEQVRIWAQQLGRLFGPMGWQPQPAGVSLQMGRGDAHLQDINAASCSLRLGNGRAGLRGGRIEHLAVHLGRGDVECHAVAPAGNWSIETKHGHIRLGLPVDASARLDVATRHGDIRSDVPLVRVPRPGPGARHGGRMVGSVGQAGQNAPEISLTTLNGDIEIGAAHPGEDRPAKPVAEGTPTQPAATTHSPVESAAAAATDSGGAQTPGQADQVRGDRQPVYESQLAILRALGERQISVEEADQLLRSLEA